MSMPARLSMTTRPTPAPVGIPRKALVGLLTGVLAAHGLALNSVSSAIDNSQRRVTRPFVTRSVALSTAAASNNAAAPPPALAAVPKKPAAPKPVPAAANPPSNPSGEVKSAVVPVDIEQLAINSEANRPASPGAEVLAQAPDKAAPAPLVAATEPEKPAAAAAPSTPPAAPLAAVAYTLPGSVRLKYNVAGTKDGLNYSARAEMLWLQDGSTYEARLEVSAFLIGARVRTSTGRLSAQGLVPTRFSDKFRTEVAAHFERDKQKVTFSANTPDAPLLPGMQDQLSVFVQIGAMLAGDRAKYPPGTALEFDTIGPRAPENWVITVGEEEKLSLPGGDMLAVKLTRGPRRDFDRTDELWLAPVVGYLPVRIKITEKSGDYVDQVWRATEAPN